MQLPGAPEHEEPPFFPKPNALDHAIPIEPNGAKPTFVEYTLDTAESVIGSQRAKDVSMVQAREKIAQLLSSLDNRLGRLK